MNTSPAAPAAHETSKLRRTVVFGAVNNLVFAVVGGALSFGQFLLVLRLVGPAQIGLYAMASVFATTIESVSEFGIGDRLIQRDADGFEASYSVAATAHFLLALALWILLLIAAPAISHFYRQPELWPLLSVMSYAAFAGVCRLPLSLLSREFRFFQQRLLMFIGKVAGFVVTVGMGYAGYGVWALVIGAMVTLAVTCVPAWMLAQVRPKWRIDRDELRSLLHFSGPLWAGRMTMIAVQQGTVLVLSLYLTTVEVGQYKAAEQIVFFLVSIDIILGQTIFPGLCRLKDSPERVGAGFTKASRASMLWLAGIGGAMIVFADSLVRYVLTTKWAGAEMFVRAQGLALIIGGVAYSWGFLFEVKGDTRPILKVIGAFGAAFALLFVPLTWGLGKPGAAIGIVAVCTAGFIARQYYVSQLGMKVSLLAIAARALGSAGLASAAVVGLRALFPSRASTGWVFAQLSVYALIYVATLAWVERQLILEVFYVLRNRTGRAVEASAPA